MTDFSDGIDLSFGEDSVQPDSFTPAPANVYNLLSQSCVPSMTKGEGEGKFREPMLTIEWVIEDGEFAGKPITDRLVIPGLERKAAKPDVWNTMMNMLRDKLEAITGREWRDDNMKLKPEDLVQCHVKAQVGVEHYDYMKNGERKVGDSNTVDKYLLPDGWDRPKASAGAAPTPAPNAAKYEI